MVFTTIVFFFFLPQSQCTCNILPTTTLTTTAPQDFQFQSWIKSIMSALGQQKLHWVYCCYWCHQMRHQLQKMTMMSHTVHLLLLNSTPAAATIATKALFLLHMCHCKWRTMNIELWSVESFKLAWHIKDWHQTLVSIHLTVWRWDDTLMRDGGSNKFDWNL